MPEKRDKGLKARVPGYISSGCWEQFCMTEGTGRTGERRGWRDGQIWFMRGQRKDGLWGHQEDTEGPFMQNPNTQLRLFCRKLKIILPSVWRVGYREGPIWGRGKLQLSMYVFSSLLGYKYSETGHRSVSCFPTVIWHKPSKVFYRVHERRYITSLPSSWLILATILLQEKVQLSWTTCSSQNTLCIFHIVCSKAAFIF